MPSVGGPNSKRLKAAKPGANTTDHLRDRDVYEGRGIYMLDIAQYRYAWIEYQV